MKDGSKIKNFSAEMTGNKEFKFNGKVLTAEPSGVDTTPEPLIVYPGLHMSSVDQHW